MPVTQTLGRIPLFHWPLFAWEALDGYDIR